MSTTWNSSSSTYAETYINGKIKKFREGLIAWSRGTFKRADRWILFLKNEIQRLQNRKSSPDVINCLNSHKKELYELWKQEELYWKVRSRVTWLNHGDKNSKFFHSSTIQRRMTNRISRIKDEDGNWVTGNEDIQGCFVEFFKSLFSSGASKDRNMQTGIIPNLVSQSIKNYLLSLVSDIEVKKATFEMGHIKPLTQMG